MLAGGTSLWTAASILPKERRTRCAWPHTLGFGPEVWRVLSRCHDLRNLAEYEGELQVTQELLQELMAICRMLLAKLGVST